MAAGIAEAAIAAYGAVRGDQMSAESASQTNAQSVAIAQMNNEFNSAEAQKNRDFQEEMASSQMQRRMGDLSKAGLNPALAYTQGGAASPSGATASSAGLPSLQNPGAAYGRIGDQLSSALSLRAQQAQIDNLSAQANKANVEAGTEVPATVKNIQSMTGLNDARAAEVQRNISMMNILLADPSGKGNSLFQEKAEAETGLTALKTQLSTMDLLLSQATVSTAIKARNDLNTAESIGAENLYHASDGAFGRFMAFFNLGKPIISGATQAAGAVGDFVP